MMRVRFRYLPLSTNSACELEECQVFMFPVLVVHGLGWEPFVAHVARVDAVAGVRHVRVLSIVVLPHAGGARPSLVGVAALTT